jgi:hypothetical protein
MAGLSQAAEPRRASRPDAAISLEVETGHKNVTLRMMAALAEAVGKEVSVLLRHRIELCVHISVLYRKRRSTMASSLSWALADAGDV